MSTLPKTRTHHLIKSLEAKALAGRPWHIKLADGLTAVFGTTGFLVLNLGLFAGWIMVNNGLVPGVPIFDPYPHVFLVTSVSLEAIILTLLVLISQNRQGQISTLREELELQVNLIAEREVTKVLQVLSEIARHNKIKLDDPELAEMLKQTDTSYIERRLVAQINETSAPLVETVTEPIKKVTEEVEKSINH